jgi:hypothetical protein
MPKNKVNDLITDQEMAFARQVLSGGVTDRQAAEAVGLNPDSAAYTKSKPRVRAYMLEHRAAIQQQIVQQEADLSRRAVEGQRRLNLDREQVLDRLWEIANLSPDMTRGSITGQVKALTMIIAMQNLIPDRRALPAEKKPTPPPAPEHQENSPKVPQPDLAAVSAAQAPPNLGPSQSTPNRVSPAKAPLPYVPLFTSVPDLGVGRSTKKNPLNPFVYPR